MTKIWQQKLLNLLPNTQHLVFIVFFITASLMLLVATVVSIYINRMEKAVKESLENHLFAAAYAASIYIPIEELDLFHTIEDIQKPEWESIRLRLMSFAEKYRVQFVYYWRIRGEKIQYIIDNDEDEENMATPAMEFVIKEDPVTAEGVPIIQSGQPWVSDLGVYTASWDGVLSGVVPIFDHDGTLYAAAGVDISDEILITQRNNIRMMRIVLLFSCILSFFSGFIGMWLYHKKAVQSDKANQAKSHYLSTMSHEIRTPMNAILGISQIELQKSNLPQEYARAFERIHYSSENLLKIINNILDLSKIEAGKLELQSVQYALPTLINDAVQTNMVRIGKKTLEFVLQVDEELPLMMIGDETRIKQILNNLLSNAVKYTEQGYVKLSVSLLGDESNSSEGNNFKFAPELTICFLVEDTGQGMKPEDSKKLFSEYIRFNTKTNRTVEGTGIGLIITKNLVEMMHGSIRVESEYGKGTLAIVKIKQKTVNQESIGKELALRLNRFTFFPDHQSASLSVHIEVMPYGKVLIVDDLETNLYVAEGLMAPYQLQLETAYSGYETIEKVEKGNHYDVIFMDHMMPFMDGVETTLKLREMGYQGAIIALTANALVGNKILFQENGFNDFISKPIDVHHLDEILCTYVRDKHPDEHQKCQVAVSHPQVNTKILNIFIKDAQKALETLHDLSLPNDLKLFTTTIHSMKSALNIIGEDDLSAFAANLEDAGQKGDLKYIETHSPNFGEALRNLLQKLSPLE